MVQICRPESLLDKASTPVNEIIGFSRFWRVVSIGLIQKLWNYLLVKVLVTFGESDLLPLLKTIPCVTL
jgi:hypothetical protein